MSTVLKKLFFLISLVSFLTDLAAAGQRERIVFPEADPGSHAPLLMIPFPGRMTPVGDDLNLEKLVNHLELSLNTTAGSYRKFEKSFEQPMTKAKAIMSVLEELEEAFVLVKEAKVETTASGFSVTVRGFVNTTVESSEEVRRVKRFVCGGWCIAGIAATLSALSSFVNTVN